MVVVDVPDVGAVPDVGGVDDINDVDGTGSEVDVELVVGGAVT
jgi:hypothetical protein